MEPRDWVGVDCKSLTVQEDYAYAIGLPRRGIFVGSELLELLVKWGVSPGIPRPTQPSQRELKDLVEYVMAMPRDLRESMGVQLLPVIPTKAVWRLNHQADPAMGWWGVMETRAGLSWGMLHQGSGVTYREVAEWLGMPAPEMPSPTGPDALYHGQQLQAPTKQSPDLPPDHAIGVGDTVEVMEGYGSWKAGDTMVVKSIDVQPWGAFLIDAGGRSLRRNRARKIAAQQEGRGYREEPEDDINIWADSEWQFKIEALARYLSCMSTAKLHRLGMSVTMQGEEVVDVVQRGNPPVRHLDDQWRLTMNRNAEGVWNLETTPISDFPPTFDTLCGIVGLDFRLDLRSQFTEQPPRAVRLWPHLFTQDKQEGREDTLEERQGLHKWLARKSGETSVVGCCMISRDRSGHTFEISTHDGKPEWLATLWPEHINFFQQDFATGWDFNLLCKALGYAEVVTLPREGDLVRVVSGGSKWTAGEVFKVAGVEKRGRATMLASGDGRSIMAYRVEIAATRVDMDADDLQKALAHLATAMDFVKSAIDARG